MFSVGQRVIFRPDLGQWYEGKILEVSSSSCRVQKFELHCESMAPGVAPVNSPGDVFSVARDSKQIRALPEESTYAEKVIMASLKPPPFRDPLEYLYNNSNRTAIATSKNAMKIGEEALQKMSKDVSRRRKIDAEKLILSYNGDKLLECVLKERVDINGLVTMASRDPTAMLQLADATNYGLLGLKRNRLRALKLYECAARGISEKEYDSCSGAYDVAYAYPLGTAESLCAAAIAIWDDLKLTSNIIPAGEVSADSDSEANARLLLKHLICAVDGQWCISVDLERLIFYLGHANRRNWLCPFLKLIGEPLRESGLSYLFNPNSTNLIQGLELHTMSEEELHPSVMKDLELTTDAPLSRETLDELSQPNNEQLKMFRPKATEIFLSLPLANVLYMRSVRVRADLHLEYREVPIYPYNISVLSVYPESGYIGLVNIPSDMAYNPFSKDAFELVWGYFVFQMHKGVVPQMPRFRPSVITFANRPGDRKLAAFIRDQIGTTCGTKIRLVDTSQCIIHQFDGNKKTLSKIVTDVELDMADGMKNDMELLSEESRIRTHIPISFYDHNDSPVDEYLPGLQRLKEEGNDFFGRGRFTAARKCYSEAISAIRAAINQDDRVHQLLGTLLSNRALCFLKMADGMGAKAEQEAMRTVVSDCEAALNNSWSKEIPPNIRKKLEMRKGEAAKRLDRLTSQNDPFTGEPDQQLQEQAPRKTQGGRRKGNKKKKQQRRKKSKKKAASLDQEEADESDDSFLQIFPGKMLFDTEGQNFGKEDYCPSCFDRFHFELADTHVFLSECGHACCMPCVSRLWEIHSRTLNSKKPLPWNCPMCRLPIPDNLVSYAVSEVLDSTPQLYESVCRLPLSHYECVEVGKSLLRGHNFVLRDVLRAIGAMLTDNLHLKLRRAKDLSPDDKQTIYEEARKPAHELLEEVSELCSRLRTMKDSESDEFQAAVVRVNTIQAELLPEALLGAQEYIWSQMNTAGKMGLIDDETGILEVDFHALHVQEAKTKFDECVLPVLEAVGSATLIVGRGKHSEGGVSKLKPALEEHMVQHKKSRFIRYSNVKDNAGAVYVQWKKQN